MVTLYRKLCHKYVLMARMIGEERGPKEAFAFLEAKAVMLQDLSSPGFCVELATLLANKGDIEKASVYFVKATKGRVIDDADSKAMDSARSHCPRLRKEARLALVKPGEPLDLTLLSVRRRPATRNCRNRSKNQRSLRCGEAALKSIWWWAG